MKKLPADHFYEVTSKTVPRHNYEVALKALFDRGLLGEFTNAIVGHEDVCAIYDGGYCDCECVIRIEDAKFRGVHALPRAGN